MRLVLLLLAASCAGPAAAAAAGAPKASSRTDSDTITVHDGSAVRPMVWPLPARLVTSEGLSGSALGAALHIVQVADPQWHCRAAQSPLTLNFVGVSIHNRTGDEVSAL